MTTSVETAMKIILIGKYKVQGRDNIIQLSSGFNYNAKQGSFAQGSFNKSSDTLNQGFFLNLNTLTLTPSNSEGF